MSSARQASGTVPTVSSAAVFRIRALPGDGTSGFDAMQAVSWQVGDEPVTDHPDVADPMLIHLVHHVNDTYCRHLTTGSDAIDWLCVSCTAAVMSLAHRTVGTVLTGRSQRERAQIHVRLATDELDTTTRHVGSTIYTKRTLAAVARWLDDPDLVEPSDLFDLAGSRPADGPMLDRAAADLAHAAAEMDPADTARRAARAALTAIENRNPSPTDLRDVQHLFDRFLALAGSQQTCTPMAVKLR